MPISSANTKTILGDLSFACAEASKEAEANTALINNTDLSIAFIL